MAMSKICDGKADLSGKKNTGTGAPYARELVMTHMRKHNPTQAPVQSKRISPGDNTPAKH